MSKVTMSFEKRRKALLNRMSSKASGQPVSKVIRFRNNDVPNFLRGLDKFESASRKVRLVIK